MVWLLKMSWNAMDVESGVVRQQNLVGQWGVCTMPDELNEMEHKHTNCTICPASKKTVHAKHKP
jgi:hypothetical protein